MDRAAAMELLRQYVTNEALIRHMICVEAAMGHYAKRLGQEESTWRIVGLLHDFDYERFPEPPDHTREGAKILREHGVSEEIISAILSHADWNIEEYPRDTPLRKTLFAVDELCGFIYAAALVRPQRLVEMKAKSIRKKMKQKSFAAAVSRDDIIAGAELLDIPLDEHINECIAAIATQTAALGLVPPDTQ